jgi:homoserine kinase type II
MGSFTTLSPDDVRRILHDFAAPAGGDDAAAAAYRGHQPIAVGTINTNVRVDTGAGPRFLRINEGKTEDDVAREAAIVLHVAARGVPTPAPVLAAGGRPFTRFAGQIVSLFPWLPGRTIARAEVQPAHARQVGAALAALHLASDGFADHRPGRYEPDEIDRRLQVIADVVPQRPELAQAVATLGPELPAARTARAAAVPLGLIHGDLFIDNVLFDDGGGGGAPALVALLDFEQASWGRFAYDLAVTLLAFAFGRDDFRADVTRALIDGYARVRPPTAAERDLFGAELCFAACRFAVTRITDVHLRRGQGAPPGKEFARYLARLGQVRRHLAARDGLLDLP